MEPEDTLKKKCRSKIIRSCIRKVAKEIEKERGNDGHLKGMIALAY